MYEPGLLWTSGSSGRRKSGIWRQGKCLPGCSSLSSTSLSSVTELEVMLGWLLPSASKLDADFFTSFFLPSFSSWASLRNGGLSSGCLSLSTSLWSPSLSRWTCSRKLWTCETKRLFSWAFCVTFKQTKLSNLFQSSMLLIYRHARMTDKGRDFQWFPLRCFFLTSSFMLTKLETSNLCELIRLHQISLLLSVFSTLQVVPYKGRSCSVCCLCPSLRTCCVCWSCWLFSWSVAASDTLKLSFLWSLTHCWTWDMNTL